MKLATCEVKPFPPSSSLASQTKASQAPEYNDNLVSVAAGSFVAVTVAVTVQAGVKQYQAALVAAPPPKQETAGSAAPPQGGKAGATKLNVAG